jgi:hypothetical protein
MAVGSWDEENTLSPDQWENNHRANNVLRHFAI